MTFVAAVGLTRKWKVASESLMFFFLGSLLSAKSLPLHCVVESVSSLQATLNFDTRSPWKRRPNIETDSYVIIPAATPFCDIVTTALQRLGYSTEISNAARGKCGAQLSGKQIVIRTVRVFKILSVLFHKQIRRGFFRRLLNCVFYV